MKYLLLEYPKCSTCRKAKKFLDDHGISYEDRHIVERNPTAGELGKWIAASGFPVRKFFNTSGLLYKSMQLKERLPEMSGEEQIGLLATNGMLVRRPLLIGGDRVLVGFREMEWAALLK
ncbi:MAG TPA: ArsC family transcriptional regulator [Lentisphaeria bacterium]|nr:ArsC family transcriptional regulator [Lentisphaeria bacterium]HCG49730.1 ArsC family transcriptional regulator [Lentisphaeria bacterium]